MEKYEKPVMEIVEFETFSEKIILKHKVLDR